MSRKQYTRDQLRQIMQWHIEPLTDQLADKAEKLDGSLIGVFSVDIKPDANTPDGATSRGVITFGGIQEDQDDLAPEVKLLMAASHQDWLGAVAALAELAGACCVKHFLISLLGGVLGDLGNPRFNTITTDIDGKPDPGQILGGAGAAGLLGMLGSLGGLFAILDKINGSDTGIDDPAMADLVNMIKGMQQPSDGSQDDQPVDPPNVDIFKGFINSSDGCNLGGDQDD